jgi:hypothetical protein
MTELRLNVLFHGTFVFCKHSTSYTNRTVTVLIPLIDSHIVKAGNWLGETSLVGGDNVVYRLTEDALATSVEPAPFPSDHNLIIKNNLHVANLSSLLHARLVLPMPDRIITPRRGEVNASEFGNQFEELRKNEKLSYNGYLGSVMIFTYRIKNLARLRLERDPKERGSHPWIPMALGPTPSAPAGTVHLHIYSEHEVEEGLEEPELAFNRMMTLFQSFPLALGRTPFNAKLETKELPDGVQPEECEDLSLRTERMVKLGRMRLSGQDLNHLWHASESFGTHSSGCACSCCC